MITQQLASAITNTPQGFATSPTSLMINNVIPPVQPFYFINTLKETPQEPELQALKRLENHGINLAPILIVSPSVEENFYASNNLADQLNKLFKGLNLNDPDEDDIEDIAPRATQLFKSHFMLDEVIDLFYSGIAQLPSHLRIRRPGERGQLCHKAHPALIALKEVWAADWQYEALLQRLRTTNSIALNARPVLLTPTDTLGEKSLHEGSSEYVAKNAKIYHSSLGITSVIS